ncbi:hypothetical protein Misp06_01321 [Microbulbifer sp. NBRC 101763]|uniref:baseplate assembly protein n=1 Tax=Microbulbifer TaxID=48073 RepID=UPI0003776803|nr:MULTISPECIES: baseplate J/gp47 family protein [Microbulbifer]WHI51668.1 baseplate J/gp47 family protein [Microbulbifer sp. MLAF003]
MTTESAVDISRLPAPNIVETLDFESIYGEMVALLDGASPLLLDEMGQVIKPQTVRADLVTDDGAPYFKIPADSLMNLSYVQMESEPLARLLQVAAYREMLTRQRVNDAARGVMVAFAVDGDLDRLGENNKTRRLEGEDDTRYRGRIPLAFEGLTTAGPKGSYKSHALAADPRVKDALASSPSDGVVHVVILSTEGNGSASPDLLEAVNNALSEKSIRPLTDKVEIIEPEIKQYSISATLTPMPGPVDEALYQRAEEAAIAYAKKRHGLGLTVARSGLSKVLHQEGIERVQLHEPEFDILNEPHQTAWCAGIEIIRG